MYRQLEKNKRVGRDMLPAELLEAGEGELLGVGIHARPEHFVGNPLLEVVPGRVERVGVREDDDAVHLIEEQVRHMKHL